MGGENWTLLDKIAPFLSYPGKDNRAFSLSWIKMFVAVMNLITPATPPNLPSPPPSTATLKVNVFTLDNLINIVLVLLPGACLCTRCIALFELCVGASVACIVHVETLVCVCTAPAFTPKLNPKENKASLGCSYSTSANESKEHTSIKLKQGNVKKI